MFKKKKAEIEQLPTNLGKKGKPLPKKKKKKKNCRKKAVFLKNIQAHKTTKDT